MQSETRAVAVRMQGCACRASQQLLCVWSSGSAEDTPKQLLTNKSSQNLGPDLFFFFFKGKQVGAFLQLFFMADTVTHDFQALSWPGLTNAKVSAGGRNSLCIWHLAMRPFFPPPIKLRKTTKHY